MNSLPYYFLWVISSYWAISIWKERYNSHQDGYPWEYLGPESSYPVLSEDCSITLPALEYLIDFYTFIKKITQISEKIKSTLLTKSIINVRYVFKDGHTFTCQLIWPSSYLDDTLRVTKEKSKDISKFQWHVADTIRRSQHYNEDNRPIRWACPLGIQWGAGRTGICLMRERPVHGRDTFHGLRIGISIRSHLLLLHINSV